MFFKEIDSANETGNKLRDPMMAWANTPVRTFTNSRGTESLLPKEILKFRSSEISENACISTSFWKSLLNVLVQFLMGN